MLHEYSWAARKLRSPKIIWCIFDISFKETLISKVVCRDCDCEHSFFLACIVFEEWRNIVSRFCNKGKKMTKYFYLPHWNSFAVIFDELTYWNLFQWIFMWRFSLTAILWTVTWCALFVVVNLHKPIPSTKLAELIIHQGSNPAWKLMISILAFAFNSSVPRLNVQVL